VNPASLQVFCEKLASGGLLDEYVKQQTIHFFGYIFLDSSLHSGSADEKFFGHHAAKDQEAASTHEAAS